MCGDFALNPVMTQIVTMASATDTSPPPMKPPPPPPKKRKEVGVSGALDVDPDVAAEWAFCATVCNRDSC